MKVDWYRELSTWAQYFFFSFVAAATALIHQAAYDFKRTNDLNDRLISDFTNAEVLKGAGVFYCWLAGVFLGLSVLRFLLLFVLSRMRVEAP